MRKSLQKNHVFSYFAVLITSLSFKAQMGSGKKPLGLSGMELTAQMVEIMVCVHVDKIIAWSSIHTIFRCFLFPVLR